MTAISTDACIPLKPALKRSHHVIVDNNGDICIGEIPGSARIIRRPERWAHVILQKMDGKHTVARIIKEAKIASPDAADSDMRSFIWSLHEFGLIEDTSYQSPSLSAEELDRYDRQILQFGLPDGDKVNAVRYQERLKEAVVLVLGMGGWGTWCSLNLALSGIGTLKIVDGDSVEISNLNRQVLYRDADVGCAKVHSAARSIAEINPHVQVECISEFAGTDHVKMGEYMRGVSLVVLGWASLGYYKKGTVEEVAHRVASANRIPIIEMGGDPFDISVGPIYPNRDGINLYTSNDVMAKSRSYSGHENIRNFQKARMANSFNNGARDVCSWQSSPSLSVMSGLLVDQVIKLLSGYDEVVLEGSRFSMSLRDMTSRIDKIF